MDNNSNLFESFSKAADDLFMEHLKESKLFSLLNTEEKENLDAIRRTAPQNIVPFLANIKEAKPDFFKIEYLVYIQKLADAINDVHSDYELVNAKLTNDASKIFRILIENPNQIISSQMAQQNYVIASSSVKKELENALDQCLAGLKKTYAKHSARHPTNKDYEVAKRKKELEDKQRDDQLTALINQNTLQMLYQNNINQMRISDRMFRNNVYGRNYNPYSRYDGK